ncbi:AMP-binding protein [Mycobacterium sp. CVI_P3]|uniref:AMP-binding protein n=1 Tax=Mycobacterium pinniadriaticum TaxID=2994102 RepID=A0ABT3SMU1_9MYCO|nr:AMP-binding protein [Mycobacterium pinniadriaticum]MCX2934422.1 AMP-binding protein [Mycobacterium pinniadriaticum]MCX2940845.1 AMP-binding protein [Mycobacterium pinniadriaticum]
MIGDILRDQADHVGDDVFLRFDDRCLSYGEINSRANAIGAGLKQLGVEIGDTVAILMENSLELAQTTFGVNKAGAIWSPTNTAYKGQWLADTFADGRARVLVVDAAYLPRVLDLNDVPFDYIVVNGPCPDDVPVPAGVLSWEELAAGQGIPELPSTANCFSTSAVMWTSGTTGRSKGVCQSHSAWLAGALTMARGYDTAEGDVFYCCVPMYNSGAWVTSLYASLVSGTQCAIDPRFSVSDFWNRCRKYEATQIFTLGAMHMHLLQQKPSESDLNNNVRVAGLIPIPPDAAAEFRRRFGVDYVWQGFGQSEVMPWSITHRGRLYKPGSCGTPRDDLDVRALDDNDEEVPVGQVGEICIRPKRPGVIFSGYFGQPEATLKAFRNLWYHSGDLGRFDEDGELFFVDRKHDFMRYKGRNISSFEIECLVSRHPAVAEAVVYGVKSQELEFEDEPKLCVLLREGEIATAEDIALFIAHNAPYYLVPRYIEFVEGFPRTPTGKVQKFKLKEHGVTDRDWDRDAAGFVVAR